MGLRGLADHLSVAPPADLEAAMAWQRSDEYREFVALSGERWYEANIAAGEAEVAARAAADRATAAYTATPEPPADS